MRARTLADERAAQETLRAASSSPSDRGLPHGDGPVGIADWSSSSSSSSSAAGGGGGGGGGGSAEDHIDVVLTGDTDASKATATTSNESTNDSTEPPHAVATSPTVDGETSPGDDAAAGEAAAPAAAPEVQTSEPSHDGREDSDATPAATAAAADDDDRDDIAGAGSSPTATLAATATTEAAAVDREEITALPAAAAAAAAAAPAAGEAPTPVSPPDAAFTPASTPSSEASPGVDEETTGKTQHRPGFDSGIIWSCADIPPVKADFGGGIMRLMGDIDCSQPTVSAVVETFFTSSSPVGKWFWADTKSELRPSLVVPFAVLGPFDLLYVLSTNQNVRPTAHHQSLRSFMRKLRGWKTSAAKPSPCYFCVLHLYHAACAASSSSLSLLLPLAAVAALLGGYVHGGHHRSLGRRHIYEGRRVVRELWRPRSV